MEIVLPFVALCLLLGVGHVLRMRFRLLQRLYLPSCVIGGLVGLGVLQGLKLIGSGEGAAGWAEWAWGTVPLWTGGWGRLPGFLINIVFACLFLGVTVPSLRTIWRRGGPQLAYGQIVAWGQYVVGVGLFLLLIAPLFADLGLPAMFGAIIPVGFEGGHGTASGLARTFAEQGWEAGKDFALASATVGIISAVVVGMALVNWAVRRGHTHRGSSPEAIPEDEVIGVIPVDRRPSAGRLTVKSDAIECFTLQLVAVGLAVGVGWAIKQLLVLAAAPIPSEGLHKALASFPLFPLCMIGGLVVQILEQRFDRHQLIDHGLTRRIQNAALDFLVVAAVATIRIDAIVHGLVPFLIIMFAAIAWNVFCVLILARRLLPDAWFERSIAELGQSMGVTATGLMLLRVVDPDYESPAADAFAYKQLMHEPFMGGGLWTSMAVPLLALWGGWWVLAIACGAVAVWFVAAVALQRSWRGN